MLDMRASRRSFLKSLAALAGVAVLPMPELAQAATNELQAVEVATDDAIWLEIDNNLYQLDYATFVTKIDTEDLGGFSPVRIITREYLYIDCGFIDTDRQVNFLSIYMSDNKAKCYQMAVRGNYDNVPVKVNGLVKVGASDSLRSNGIALVPDIRLEAISDNGRLLNVTVKHR